MFFNLLNHTAMKTKEEKLAAIRERFTCGTKLSASLTIKTIGSKYITCVSIMGSVHDVRYTIADFFEHYCN